MSEASGNRGCLCKKTDCYYMRNLSNKCDKFCAFCYLTGEPRGCPIEECTRYISITEKQRRKIMILEKLKWKDYNPEHMKKYNEQLNEVKHGTEEST